MVAMIRPETKVCIPLTRVDCASMLTCNASAAKQQGLGKPMQTANSLLFASKSMRRRATSGYILPISRAISVFVLSSSIRSALPTVGTTKAMSQRPICTLARSSGLRALPRKSHTFSLIFLSFTKFTTFSSYSASESKTMFGASTSLTLKTSHKKLSMVADRLDTPVPVMTRCLFFLIPTAYLPRPAATDQFNFSNLSVSLPKNKTPMKMKTQMTKREGTVFGA
mmetsp:Transcript_15517/g.46033  ORF Transcript_15517/g.46033 Transcript_15517/m.46033 type:complete len:224 (+) Transcript_15517:1440-2111(+)